MEFVCFLRCDWKESLQAQGLKLPVDFLIIDNTINTLLLYDVRTAMHDKTVGDTSDLCSRGARLTSRPS
jgi:hypothetical protein